MKDGLQDLAVCDFSNPGLCGFETNCSVNSGYSWRIASGELNKNGITHRTTAEGNTYFIYIIIKTL